MQSGRPLLLIAEDVEGEVLATRVSVDKKSERSYLKYLADRIGLDQGTTSRWREGLIARGLGGGQGRAASEELIEPAADQPLRREDRGNCGPAQLPRSGGQSTCEQEQLKAVAGPNKPLISRGSGVSHIEKH